MSEPPVTLALATCRVDLARRAVVQPDGNEQPLGRIEALLLGYLAARPHEDVPRAELLKAVWNQDDDGATRVVDLAVNRLRDKLDDLDPPRHLLTAHGVGYRFAPLPATEPAPAQRRPAAAAVRVWIAGGGAIDLGRRCIEAPGGATVALTRLEAELLDRLASALGHPVAHELLIAQLWGRGRHERSLAATLSRLRRKIEPDPAHPRVIVTSRGVGTRLDGRLDAPTLAEPAPALEPEGAPFVDRPEVDRIVQLASAYRVVSLVGPGGTGKTRLALRAAAQVAATRLAAVRFCDLAPAFDEHGVVGAVARALGIDGSGADPSDQVVQALARRSTPTVLVLDNLEHLNNVAGLLRAWIAAAPAVRWWTTSRLAIDLDRSDQVVVEIGPMDDDAGAALFVGRYGRSGADPVTVARLVRHLDGLPLAIELAAARAVQIGPDAVLARIDARLDLLVRRPEAMVSHHSTLRGAYDASWDLLDADERSVLAATSVLVAPFGAAIAAALVDRPCDETGACLARLAAWSLLARVDGAGYRQLENTRAYADEKLALSGAADDVERRRAAYVLGQTTDWHGVLGPAEPASPGLLEELVAVYRRASDTDTAALAAVAVSLDMSASTPLALELLEGAAARDPSRAIAFRVWRRLATLRRTQNNDVGAEAAHDRAEQLADTDHDRATLVRSRGVSRLLEDRTGSCAAMLRRAREALLACGDHALAAVTLGNYARSSEVRTLADGVRLLEQADADAVAAGVTTARAVLLHHLAHLLLNMGRIDEARERCDEALALAAAGGDHWTIARLDTVHALITLECGGILEARRQFDAIEQRLLASGLVRAARDLRAEWGAVAVELGDLDAAEVAIDGAVSGASTVNRGVIGLLRGRMSEAATVLQGLRSPRAELYALCFRAVALAELGDGGSALTLIARARSGADPDLWGFDRVLALCEAAVDVARGADPACARADAVLAAGILIEDDAGQQVERPQDAMYARMVLASVLRRHVGRGRA